MLRRLKPSPFPFLGLCIDLLRSSSYSSKSKYSPKILIKKTPNSSNRKNTTKSLQLFCDSNQIPIKHSNPIAESILSLLSDPSVPSQNLEELLQPFKDKLTSDSVLETLKNYKVLGRPKTLEFFSWAGFQLGFRFDDRVLEFMADFLGRRKLFDDLKCLLKTVSFNKGPISTKTIAICIRFLGRQGRVLEAIALFKVMESEFGCCPDNLVFNNLLYVLCKKDPSCDSIDIALDVFRKIREPDKYTYSNVIAGLCKFGRLESAFEVFHEMIHVNLVPTRTAVNLLVGKLCEMASKSKIIEKVRVTDVRRPFDILVPNVRAKYGIEPAFQIFWTVLKMGVMPSAHIVNGLIVELCRVGKFEDAVEVVKVVENRKLRCIDESYSILIKALCDVHRVNDAHEMFERMMFLGLRPKLTVYNSIIRAFCKLGNADEAGKYLRIMNKRRCEPDCATFTMLVHAHCKIQNWEAAFEFLTEMIELGWHPQVDIYNLVDGLLKENRRPDLSLKLERKLETQRVLSYCKAGRLEDACDVLNSMVEKGHHLPVYTRNSVQRAFERSGKWKRAQGLLEMMDRAAIHKSV